MQRHKRWAVLVVPLSILLILAASFGYTNYVFGFVCDYIRIQAVAYQESPPSTATGKQMQEDINVFLSERCD